MEKRSEFHAQLSYFGILPVNRETNDNWKVQARKSYYGPFMRVVDALETKPKKVEALQPIEGFYFGR